MHKEPRKMHPKISEFLAIIENEHKAPIRALVAKRDADLAAIDKRMQPLQAQVNKAQTELTQARQSLEKNSLTATAADLAVHQVIIDQWPARINQAQEELEPLRVQSREIERQYGIDLKHHRALVNLEVKYAIQDLQIYQFDVLKFVE